MLKSKRQCKNPASLKKIIDNRSDDFLGYSQRDAHEFLRSLLHFFHEDLEIKSEKFSHKRPNDLNDYSKWWYQREINNDNSLIRNLFRGITIEEITCV